MPSSLLCRLFGPAAAAPRLRDESRDASPVVVPGGAATTAGRYRILGEIARGGLGVVLRGHDAELGRDVAVKVVRDEVAGHPDVIRRFVEEAQIGGQLQHPGIVPVYELGIGDDRRPYFTMKLVKGRTLAALLAERSDPRQDLRRFVAAFEALCQTMAYAHARGVIHRDLKPANVMTGSFGEVLVVDWGMGKVLTREEPAPASSETSGQTRIATRRPESSASDSEMGSVLGTPRYMPPEQAMGRVDDVDERSDVFALGAILCEILTGAPPYEGEGIEALRHAARAELG